MKQQTIDNLRGEIEFRKKLAKQHVTGEIFLPDYYKKEDLDRILLERVTTTAKRMSVLKEQGVELSPFIEFGAERCQRSLVLANDFNANGIAVDISFHQLKTAEHYANLFHRPKIPLRVCCDANRLPFKNSSFNFAFCYEFLHHFPTPKPIIREISRLLANGVFFFDEEPFKRPKMVLYKQKNKVYSESRRKKNIIVQLIEHFISEVSCEECEHGIIENDKISIREWREALSVFEDKKMHITCLGRRIQSELGKRVKIKNLPILFLGGWIEGVCRKREGEVADKISDLKDMLTCPDCMIGTDAKEVIDQPSLIRQANHLICELCNSSFPVIDDVFLLLPSGLRKQLYPEFT